MLQIVADLFADLQPGLPEGAERQGQPPLTKRGTELRNSTQRYAGQSIPNLTERVSGLLKRQVRLLLI